MLFKVSYKGMDLVLDYNIMPIPLQKNQSLMYVSLYKWLHNMDNISKPYWVL